MKRLGLFALLLALVLGYTSVFVIHEGSRGIVIQFGKVKRDSNTNEVIVYSPGLHFKVPLIDKVRSLDARIQTLDGQPDRFVTSEKKDLIIDSYVKWMIADFSAFYLSTGGDFFQAENLLKRKIGNALRSEIGARTITEIVSGERSEVMEDALRRSARSAELGIQVLDVRVKQINLPLEVSNSIYNRMRAERHAVAREHRSQGREQAEIIRAEIDKKVTVMLADAEKHARETRGEGDAESARIFGDAYRQSPEFFSFWRSMKAYEESFKDRQDLLVIRPDSEFFKYMKDPAAD